jgi:hypothetical protein
MTPKHLYYALEDWKFFKGLERNQLFYTSSPEIISKFKPDELMKLPWDKERRLRALTQEDWADWDNKI